LTEPPGPSSAPERILTRRFAVLWGVGFLTYASVYLLVPVLPLFLRDAGLSTGLIGVLLGIMSAVALFTRPFAGWLSDGLGRRPLIIAGVAALLVFPLVAVRWTGIGVFALLQAIRGFGWGSLTSNANTLAGELAPPGQRGEAIGVYTAAGSLSLALSPVLGLAIARQHGYAAALWTAAGLTVAALALAFLLYQSPRAPLRPLRADTLIAVPALGPAAVVAAHAMNYGGVVFFLPVLAEARELGSPGVFFTLYAVALVALRGVAGRLSDRYGRATIIVPGLVCSASTMALLAVASARWHMLAAAPLLALSMALVQPPSLAWALDLGGERRGVAMATMVAAQDLGVALGGIALGAIGQRGGYATLYGAGAAMTLAAVAWLLVVARRLRGPSTRSP
jgi:predicted MFS family arabinose efflux permease